jgi:hypothetical protein
LTIAGKLDTILTIIIIFSPPILSNQEVIS